MRRGTRANSYSNCVISSHPGSWPLSSLLRRKNPAECIHQRIDLVVRGGCPPWDTHTSIISLLGHWIPSAGPGTLTSLVGLPSASLQG